MCTVLAAGGWAAGPGQVPIAGAGLGAPEKPVTFVFVLKKSHPEISLSPWWGVQGGLRGCITSGEMLVHWFSTCGS